MDKNPGDFKKTFILLEQTLSQTNEHILVNVEYTDKPYDQVSDYSGMLIQISRPGEMPFSQIVIEYRSGQTQILLWDDPDSFGGDPLKFTPDPSKASFCLKCGCDWSTHNGDGSCVKEN